MDRMKGLLGKNLTQFLIYTAIFLLCCSPLFFFALKFFYTKDLDELIIYRSDEFISEKLPTFTISEIDIWNKYNEDIRILPHSDSYTLDTTVEEFLYNKAEGHNIDYRLIYREVVIEGQPYILLSQIPMIENKDLIGNLITQYGLIFILLMISLTIVQRVISKRSWAPFYSTLNKIDGYTLDSGVAPEFDKTNIKEFARLNGILTNLISENLRIFRQQKEFIENASHELQTPLAVFQSQLDLLLQEPNLTDKQTDIIQSLYSTSSRLTRLNKNLLLLAKIDNSQFKEMQEFDLKELVAYLIPYLKDFAENNGIRFILDLEESFNITGNIILVESLVTNLIVNAIRHNTENGDIHIQTTNNSFIISNTKGNETLDSQRIFQRFNHTTEEKKGNGLGLSIVSQICKFHKWTIKYTFVNNRHQFTVNFKP